MENAITAQVYPAYQKLIDYFQALLPKTTTDDGVWKLPDGDAYYAYLCSSTRPPRCRRKRFTSSVCAKLRGSKAKCESFSTPTDLRASRSSKPWMSLGKDPRFLYSNDDEAGRAAALAEYQRLIDEAIDAASNCSSLRPERPVEVQRVPEFKEATAPGAYYDAAAMDGTRPGVFYANLRDMNEVPKWSMPTLAYHEGVPGHHWQISIAQELKGLPQFRKVIPFTAYMEGWALYAEWLAKEAGWYDE